MSCYFNEPLLAAKHKTWLTEAMNHLNDTRNHYAKQLVPLVQNGEDASIFLQLIEVRRNAKPFNKGPYHDEVFPFSHLSPEEEIIKNNCHSEKLISQDLSSLIADLTIAYG